MKALRASVLGACLTAFTGCAASTPSTQRSEATRDDAAARAPSQPTDRGTSLPVHGGEDAWRSIGVIDMQAAILSTVDGQRAQSELKQLFDSRQRELDDRQQAMMREQQQLARLKPEGDQAKRRRADFDARMIALQEAYVGFQRELKEREAAITGPMLHKMRGIVEEVAAKRGMRFVIDKTAMPVAPQENDLTDEAIRAYDAASPKSHPRK